MRMGQRKPSWPLLSSNGSGAFQKDHALYGFKTFTLLLLLLLKTDFRVKGTLQQPWIDFFISVGKKVKVHLELFLSILKAFLTFFPVLWDMFGQVSIFTALNSVAGLPLKTYS